MGKYTDKETGEEHRTYGIPTPPQEGNYILMSHDGYVTWENEENPIIEKKLSQLTTSDGKIVTTSDGQTVYVKN